MAQPPRAIPAGSPAVGSGGQSLASLGNAAFAKMPQVSGELLAIMYGSLVRQLTVDCTGTTVTVAGGAPGVCGTPADADRALCDSVNAALLECGMNIGMRLIDEFAAKSGAAPCRTFAQTGDAIAKVGLKMFLGVSADVVNAVGNESYSLVFAENPLTPLVDLPDRFRQGGLVYCNIICGVVRGALEQVGFHVETSYVRDPLRGDNVNEIRVIFKEKARDLFMPPDE